ncbi:MAG: hypothetical protein N2C14_08920, partial [Planctomycetales bacterium]
SMASWKKVGCVSAVVLCGLLVGGAWFVNHKIDAVIRNAYAVWWVADMIIVYMEDNDNAWPQGWDDLHKPYEKLVERSRRAWTFEELRARVEVDWDADPSVLADASPVEGEPPFRVIWLRDGTSSHWSGREPNRMILDHLLAENATE